MQGVERQVKGSSGGGNDVGPRGGDIEQEGERQWMSQSRSRGKRREKSFPAKAGNEQLR